MKKENVEERISSKVLQIRSSPNLSLKSITSMKFMIFKYLNKANSLYVALDATTIKYLDEEATAHILLEPIVNGNKKFLHAYLFTSYEKAAIFAYNRNQVTRFGPAIARMERYPAHHDYIFLTLLKLGVKRFVINAYDRFEITLAPYEIFYKFTFIQRRPFDYENKIDYSSDVRKICQMEIEEIVQRDDKIRQMEVEKYRCQVAEINQMVGKIRKENYLKFKMKKMK
jgi:hypothetical protein